MKTVFISAAGPLAPRLLIERLQTELTFIGVQAVSQEFDPRQPDRLEEVRTIMSRCDAVIGFVMDASPASFFELGVALGLGLKTFLILGREVAVPFDMMRTQFARYDPYTESTIPNILDWVQRDLRPSNRKPIEFKDLSDYFNAARGGEPAADMISAHDFETLCREWFRQRKVDVTSQIDEFGGYDFELNDYHGQDKVLVEVKKYARENKVSIREVQQLLGILHAKRADGGIIVSATDFTASARNFASQCKPAIKLWTVEDVLTAA